MMRSWSRLGGRAVVVGGGPVGAAAGVVLRRHGFDVHIFERFPDLRVQQLNARRSINLVLARRGLRLAESLGLRESLLETAVPVYGRMMHTLNGGEHYQPYGHEHECNYAIGRGILNSFWLQEAEKAGVKLHFERLLENFSLDDGVVTFTSSEVPAASGVDKRNDVIVKKDSSGHLETIDGVDLLIGCDGAGSKVRTLLGPESLGMKADFVNWGYKEINFPVSASSGLSRDALHIWPRGKHMLMALANPDGSFTGTIYVDSSDTRPDGSLPVLSEGPTFQNTNDESGANAFFAENYPDVLERLGEGGLRDYRENSAGLLGNVRLDQYYCLGKKAPVLLAGDAAHAVVPFFGQGVQCGFEDVFVLSELLDKHGTSGTLDVIAAEYSRSRVRSCHALREMAMDNMHEMGDRVGQERFRLKKEVEARIETQLSHKYRSRYAQVCYSYNDYADVLEVGSAQDMFLEKLIEGVSVADAVDMRKAESWIDDLITPEFERRGMTLDFGSPP
mmetsp:Transcript_24245/g.38819  ORF Transcript_24245/g.38819 Transcript_24245/m.38819 type:complete len:504 (+) Transcript_24245:77-1588(+)